MPLIVLRALDNVYLINIPPTVLGVAPKTTQRFPDKGIWCYPNQGPRGPADTSLRVVEKLNKMKLLITTILIISSYDGSQEKYLGVN